MKILRVLVAGAFALAVACTAFSDLPEEQACRDIPKGGCPAPAETDGDLTANCIDPTCAALYACELDGGWTLTAKCPDAHVDLDAGHHDGGYSGVRDVDFDVPEGAWGGSGCEDLEPPDCPLSLALACPPDDCCGCQAIFVCKAGVWIPWGECTEAGALVSDAGR